MYGLFSIVEFAHPKRALALPSWTSLARLAAISSARLLGDFTIERSLPLPYQLLRLHRKSSLKRRELRSSPFNFAELFRSVCRNVSGKLLSHAFAALTGLCGVPPHELLADFIVLQNSHEFCNTSNISYSELRFCAQLCKALVVSSYFSNIFFA